MELVLEIATKTCSSCKENKPLLEFHKHSRTKDGLQAYCKPCRTVASREWVRANSVKNYENHKNWVKRNPELAKRTKRKARLKRDYGLTVEQFEAMLKEQNYVCAICEMPFGSKTCIDHDHKSGRVRGLLCSLCNVAVERLDNITGWSNRAMNYLAKATGTL